MQGISSSVDLGHLTALTWSRSSTSEEYARRPVHPRPLYIPQHDLLLIASPMEGTIRVHDAETLAVVQTVDIGVGATHPSSPVQAISLQAMRAPHLHGAFTTFSHETTLSYQSRYCFRRCGRGSSPVA